MPFVSLHTEGQVSHGTNEPRKHRVVVRIKLAYWLACVSVLVCGCADLSSIKRFTSASADSANYTRLVKDYVQSAERLKEYEPANQGAVLEKTIAERKAQEAPLLGLFKGVQEYMNALGALASDQLISYDESMSGVVDGLKATKLIRDDEAEALGSLGKLLAAAVTDGYRQDRLKVIIRQANPHFQRVASALAKIVKQDFVASLDTEKDAANLYFQTVIEKARHAPPQDAAIELVKESWRKRIDELDRKREACLVYAAAIEKIGLGHQTLYDHSNQLSSDQLLSAMGSYGTSIAQLMNQVEQLPFTYGTYR
jgi:hypothetical protein